MSLTKVTYVNGETVIYAENLNDIQDEVIRLENEKEDELSFTDDGNGNITIGR